MNYQNFTATEHKTKTKTGKHSSSTTIDYTYNAYLELGLCEWTDGLGKCWVADEMYSDLATFNSKTDAEGAPLSFHGSGMAEPTPFMQQHHPGKGVPYDFAFLDGYVFLGQNSASIPSYSFEVKGSLRPSGDTIDANIASIIRDMIARAGMGDYVDEESWKNYYDYCKAADWLASTPDGKFDRQDKIQTFIAELLDISNTMMYWSNGKFKFCPMDDRDWNPWKPNKTVIIDLNHDDLAIYNNGVVTVVHKDTTEIYNRITVNFTSRANEYEKEAVVYQDPENIKKFGIRSLEVNADWLHTKKRAVQLAESKARKALIERNEYQFQLGWKYAFLEVGDLVRITDPAINLENQVVMITEIVENENGLLTIKAIQRPDGDYSAGQYDIVEDNYEFVDINYEPSNTKAPIFIQPPASLITSPTGLEIWIAIRGEDENWGGCNVWASNEDGGYEYYCKHPINSNVGTLQSDLAMNSDSMVVEFPARYVPPVGSDMVAAADRGATAIWIDGEIISYESCQLVAANKYTLSKLRRGQNGTVQTSHSGGGNVVVLDGSLCAVYLNKHAMNETIHFKFPAFNILGRSTQQLEDVPFYSFIFKPYDLPNCTDLTAYSRFSDFSGSGFYPRYDVIVQWTPPDGMDTYMCAQVWYKSSTTSVAYADDGETIIEPSEAGFAANWVCAGTGYSSLVIPQCDLGATYKIAVCTQSIHGFVESPDESAQTTVTVAARTTVPLAPSNVVLTCTSIATVTWDPVTNSDILEYRVYYVDENDEEELLTKTNGTAANVKLTNRSGRIRVYAVSVWGSKSAGTTIVYAYPQLPQPKKPYVYEGVGGLRIDMDDLPEFAYGYAIYINGKKIESAVGTYTYITKSGNYEIDYAFTDCFGEGARSGSSRINYVIKIDPTMLAEGSITAEMLDKAVKDSLNELKDQQTVNDMLRDLIKMNSDNIVSLQGDIHGNATAITATNNKITNLATQVDGTKTSMATITTQANSIISRVQAAENDIVTAQSQIEQYADKISSIVSGLNGEGSEQYSAIVQLKNAIGLCVKDSDLDGREIISRINLSPNTVSIDGKLVHITGQTLFDDDVILRGHMSAGSISCDDGLVISAGAASLTKEGLRVQVEGGGSVDIDEQGMTFSDANGYKYAGVGRIAVGTATTDAETGTVRVNFEHPFVHKPYVMISPQIMPRLNTAIVPDAKEICDVLDIDNTGFVARCGVYMVDYPTDAFMSSMESAGTIPSAKLNNYSETIDYSNPAVNGNIPMGTAYAGEWTFLPIQIPENVKGVSMRIGYDVVAPNVKSWIRAHTSRDPHSNADDLYSDSRISMHYGLEFAAIIMEDNVASGLDRVQYALGNTKPTSSVYTEHDYELLRDVEGVAEWEKYGGGTGQLLMQKKWGEAEKLSRFFGIHGIESDDDDLYFGSALDGPNIAQGIKIHSGVVDGAKYNYYLASTLSSSMADSPDPVYGLNKIEIRASLEALNQEYKETVANRSQLVTIMRNGNLLNQGSGRLYLMCRYVMIVNDKSDNRYWQYEYSPFSAKIYPGYAKNIEIKKVNMVGENPTSGDYKCYMLGGNATFNWTAIENPSA